MGFCLANLMPRQRRWRFSSIGSAIVLNLVFSTMAFGLQNATDVWHKVERGDTLWDLAKEYSVSVKSIVHTNKLTSPNQLGIGKKILIPRTSNLQQADGIWHEVRRGDTLWALAKKHGVPVRSIAHTNKLTSPNQLSIGKKILIPRTSNLQQADGIWHEIRRGDTLWALAKKHGIPVSSIVHTNRIQAENPLRVGTKILIPLNSDSQHAVGSWHEVRRGDTVWDLSKRYRVPLVDIVRFNRLSSPNSLQIGTRLFVPGDRSSEFASPLSIPLTITSKYGYRRHPISKDLKFHRGIDLRARAKSRVYASRTGKITRAGWYGGYGNVIVIEHNRGYTTWYGHLSSVWVKVGQKIKQSEPIGLSGRSGHATGPHLHFEIRRNGKSVDPSRYIGLP